MLDGDSFVMAGWVHNLRAHLFKHNGDQRWLVMGKVNCAEMKESTVSSASTLLRSSICKD